MIIAWRRALVVWDDPMCHDAVRGLAAKHEQFAWLAARYGEVANRLPDDSVAPARLARLQRATIAAYQFKVKIPETTERMPYRGAAVLLLASVFATMIGLWLVD